MEEGLPSHPRDRAPVRESRARPLTASCSHTVDVADPEVRLHREGTRRPTEGRTMHAGAGARGSAALRAARGRDAPHPDGGGALV